jgi:preprotein translocase subunit SecD
VVDSRGTQQRRRSRLVPVLVVTFVALIAVALLAATVLLLVRTILGGGDSTGGDGPGEKGTRSGDSASSTGTVRFRLVTEQRMQVPGTSCPKAHGWTAFDQQCLRLGGGFTASATAEATHEAGTPVVAVILHPPADRKLATYTQRYQNRQIAVLVGRKVLAAPVVTQPITGGELQISGRFSEEQTVRLAEQINGS